jgi:hypothetical protein
MFSVSLQVRVNTRLLYQQTKFNLLREESEGYAKLVYTSRIVLVLQLLITLLSFIGMSKSRSAVIHLSCLLYVVVFTSLMKENYKRACMYFYSTSFKESIEQGNRLGASVFVEYLNERVAGFNVKEI